MDKLRVDDTKTQQQTYVYLMGNTEHNSAVMLRGMTSQINSKMSVCLVCSGYQQRKYQSYAWLALCEENPRVAGNTWWRHQRETYSALLALGRGIHRSPVNSPHKGQWCSTLMFSLISACINDWVNIREAVDLRRHGAHYDVTVMSKAKRDSLSWRHGGERTPDNNCRPES